MDLLTSLRPRHALGKNLQSLDIHVSTIFGMVFRRGHLAHLRPRHVQVIVSQSQSIHFLLKGALEWNDAIHVCAAIDKHPQDSGVST